MRNRASYYLFAAALCFAGAPTPAAAQGGTHNLRCEDAVNPRNVKTLHPQLSWEINVPQVQRAYQILVASSEEKLKNDEADLWDSGIVVSDKKTAQYEGKPLSSLQHCYWKIRIWENYYQASGYSPAQSWQMAVLTFGGSEPK